VLAARTVINYAAPGFRVHLHPMRLSRRVFLTRAPRRFFEAGALRSVSRRYFARSVHSSLPLRFPMAFQRRLLTFFIVHSYHLSAISYPKLYKTVLFVQTRILRNVRSVKLKFDLYQIHNNYIRYTTTKRCSEFVECNCIRLLEKN